MKTDADAKNTFVLDEDDHEDLTSNPFGGHSLPAIREVDESEVEEEVVGLPDEVELELNLEHPIIPFRKESKPPATPSDPEDLDVEPPRSSGAVGAYRRMLNTIEIPTAEVIKAWAIERDQCRDHAGSLTIDVELLDYLLSLATPRDTETHPLTWKICQEVFKPASTQDEGNDNDDDENPELGKQAQFVHNKHQQLQRAVPEILYFRDSLLKAETVEELTATSSRAEGEPNSSPEPATLHRAQRLLSEVGLSPVYLASRREKRLFPLGKVTFVAQKDFVQRFETLGHHPEWLPLWASREVEPKKIKRYGAVFIGTLNEKLNPERVAFFKALEQLVPIVVKAGNWWEIFPEAEIVINQTVKGDLNFRVFETMMSGACLLTEASGNGLYDFFRAGEHILVYEKGNVTEAAESIRAALADIPKIRRIAAAGRAEVIAKHCESHRANVFIAALERLQKRTQTSQKHFAAMANFAVLGNRWEKGNLDEATAALKAALQCADRAREEKELLDEDLACLFVSAALRYDARTKANLGETTLDNLIAAYPDSLLLSFAKIHKYLSRGEMSQAEALAREVSTISPPDLFKAIDELLVQLLELT